MSATDCLPCSECRCGRAAHDAQEIADLRTAIAALNRRLEVEAEESADRIHRLSTSLGERLGELASAAVDLEDLRAQLATVTAERDTARAQIHRWAVLLGVDKEYAELMQTASLTEFGVRNAWLSSAAKKDFDAAEKLAERFRREKNAAEHEVAELTTRLSELLEGQTEVIAQANARTDEAMNADHLEDGDQGKNVRDCVARGRHKPGRVGRRRSS